MLMCDSLLIADLLVHMFFFDSVVVTDKILDMHACFLNRSSMSLGFDTLTSNLFCLYITCSPHTHPDLVQDLTMHKHSIQKTYFLKTSYPGM